MPAVKLLSKSQDGRGSYVIEYIEIYLYRGGHGYCGIELFSSGILVILILMCGMRYHLALPYVVFHLFR